MLSVSDYECNLHHVLLQSPGISACHITGPHGQVSATVIHTNTPRQVGLARKHCSFFQYDFWGNTRSDKMINIEIFLPEIKPVYSTEEGKT